MPRTLYRRLVFRRQFLGQLPIIVAHRWRPRDRAGTAFVSLMGGVGDLVNFFPTLEKLAERGAVDMGTAGDPSLALVRNSPSVRRLYSPFVYKPHRPAHRRLITRVLSPFYERVLLLDLHDKDWWRTGRHISAVYAAGCGCPPPARGAVYLSDRNRRDADACLARLGLRDFILVTQLVRRRAGFRSWPLPHYHALYRLLRERFDRPILVDTFGSEATEIPSFCVPCPPLDVMTTAAMIERARVFIGTDSGLTHVAAALGVPTVAVHLGYRAENSGALGDNVVFVRQRRPFDDPAATSPGEVIEAVEAARVKA